MKKHLLHFLRHGSVATVLVAIMLCCSMTANARDYVISYTNGNTTYYIGMNGNAIQAKTSFDPTCIWGGHIGNAFAGGNEGEVRGDTKVIVNQQ